MASASPPSPRAMGFLEANAFAMLLSRCLVGLENEGAAVKTIRQGPGSLFDAGQMRVFGAITPPAAPAGAGAGGGGTPGPRAGRIPTGAARTRHWPAPVRRSRAN